MPADDGEGGRGLESRLRADLESLGFGAADVDHIEVIARSNYAMLVTRTLPP